jgi:predicted ester cyclase
MATERAIRSKIDIVREYNQKVFNEHSPDLASAYLTLDVKWHGGTLGTIEGVQNVTAMLRGFIGALPDLHAAEQDMVAASDTVAVRFLVEATLVGNLLGIAPTGRRVVWDAVDIYGLADGMIVEEWAADDTTAILYQVGAYTPPWLARNPG